MPLELNHISRACLHNNHSSPQHQRYPRDPQHSTPKGFLLYHNTTVGTTVPYVKSTAYCPKGIARRKLTKGIYLPQLLSSVLTCTVCN
jgi:hypothetical protein